MVQTTWDELPGHYPGVETDAFVIMPNRIHAIIVLSPVGAGPVPALLLPALSLPALLPAALSTIASTPKKGNHGGLPLPASDGWPYRPWSTDSNP